MFRSLLDRISGKLIKIYPHLGSTPSAGFFPETGPRFAYNHPWRLENFPGVTGKETRTWLTAEFREVYSQIYSSFALFRNDVFQDCQELEVSIVPRRPENPWGAGLKSSLRGKSAWPFSRPSTNHFDWSCDPRC